MITCNQRQQRALIINKQRGLPSRFGSVRTRSAVVDRASKVHTIELKAIPLTSESFKPFGQVIGSEEDGKLFDERDAQLVLDRGTPRFYIMRLPARGLRFRRITYHANVTQCLGVLAPVHEWYMAVARPSGSVTNYPRPEDLTVFRIPHGCYVKMDMGTWHAGPLFEGPAYMDFYNLELKDTNSVDHNTHDYRRHDACEFRVLV